MADAFWMQLGANPTFALEVNGQIVGITYWVEAGGPGGEGVAEDLPASESAWYWVSVGRPRNHHRVARGLELRLDMSEEELAQTVQDMLEVAASEVLAEGGNE